LTLEYHVLLFPLFRWELLTPKTPQDLKELMEVLSRLFSFKWFTEGQIEGRPKPIDWSPILSRRLSHITHEVHRVHEITKKAKEVSKEMIEELKVERI